MVGIVIRSNTNESNLDQIIKMIKVINFEISMSKTTVISGDLLSNISESAEYNDIIHVELTPTRRILYRAIMGAVPALFATFLAQKIIEVISICSGFLAPPFVIIFPCLLTINLYKKGQIQ